jgi:hypothetical protein
MPLKENPVPVTSPEVTVTLVAPAEREAVSAKLLPTVTLLKSKAVGETPSSPGARPFPESATVMLALVALLVTVTVPVAAPLAAGENVTLTLMLLPASTEKGTAGTELSVKPVPEMATFETLTLFVVPLTRLTAVDLLLPTATLPRSRLAGEADRVPGLVPPPPGSLDPVLVELLAMPVPPAHPISRLVANNAPAKNHVLRIR